MQCFLKMLKTFFFTLPSPSGVGGIETEAVMLGQPVCLTLPQVVGCKLVGTINPLTTSIDIVLGITKVTLLCPLVLLYLASFHVNFEQTEYTQVT